MSTYFIRLIPQDPSFVPLLKDESRIRALVGAVLPAAENVAVDIYDTPVFVDQGQDFVAVACPSCDQSLDIGWWQGAMDAAAAAEFRELSVETPCCSKQTSLNELKYDMPAGFARFVVEIRDPGVAALCEPSQLVGIEREVGSRLRQIFARY